MVLASLLFIERPQRALHDQKIKKSTKPLDRELNLGHPGERQVLSPHKISIEIICSDIIGEFSSIQIFLYTQLIVYSRSDDVMSYPILPHLSLKVPSPVGDIFPRMIY